jgi:ankyrin repeat protein
MKTECISSPWYYLFLLVIALTIITGRLEQGSSVFADEPKYTQQQTRLIYAIWDHDLKGINELLQEGLSPNFLFRRDPQDALITPLTESIAGRQPQIFALLLQHGAEANFGEKEGAGALSVAAWYNDVEMVKELIKRGASVDARDSEGHTPVLMAAARSNDLAVIKLLVAAGADAKAKSTKSQMTTVMVAASNLNLDAVKFFIDLGVDPCAKDSTGETAVDSANTPILRANEKEKLNARRAILELLNSKCSVH